MERQGAARIRFAGLPRSGSLRSPPRGSPAKRIQAKRLNDTNGSIMHKWPNAKWHKWWGWRLSTQFTQGSSLLATLGWRTQSLRDLGGNTGLVRNAQGEGLSTGPPRSRESGRLRREALAATTATPGAGQVWPLFFWFLPCLYN